MNLKFIFKGLLFGVTMIIIYITLQNWKSGKVSKQATDVLDLIRLDVINSVCYKKNLF